MIRTAVWSASPGHRLSHASVTRQARLRGSLIGILTQTSGLVEHLDLLGNHRLAASFRTRRASREELERLLSRGGASRRPGACSPSTLSGGETARANLAVA